MASSITQVFYERVGKVLSGGEDEYGRCRYALETVLKAIASPLPCRAK